MLTLKELRTDLFQLEIPLPNSPLKSINSYLLKDGDRLLVIDLGFNHPQCFQVLTSALEELGYAHNQIQILLTHSHPDHVGNLENFNLDTLTIYAPMSSFDEVHEFYRAQEPTYASYLDPLLDNDCKEPLRDSGGLRHYLSAELLPLNKRPPLHLLSDGDPFSWGHYTFKVIHCPGHDKWHLCLWETSHHFLIAGDVILERMSPVVVSWNPQFNALAQFLTSLNSLKELPISSVLPAHGKIIHDAYARIDELLYHHQERLSEIERLVNAGNAGLLDITRLCTWKYDNWDSWKIDQKYFALGETLAHLIYLDYQKRIHLVQEGVRFYAHPTLQRNEIS